MPKRTPGTLKLSVPQGHGGNGHLELDGVDISAQVTGVTLSVAVGEINEATITYSCQVMEIDGTFHVTHRCPHEGMVSDA